MTAWIALCVGCAIGAFASMAVALTVGRAECRRRVAGEADAWRERLRAMKHELLAETIACPPDTAGEPPIPDDSRRTRRLVELARRGHDLACRIGVHASRPMYELPEHESMLIHLAAVKLSDAMKSLVNAAIKAGARSGF